MNIKNTPAAGYKRATVAFMWLKALGKFATLFF